MNGVRRTMKIGYRRNFAYGIALVGLTGPLGCSTTTGNRFVRLEYTAGPRVGTTSVRQREMDTTELPDSMQQIVESLGQGMLTLENARQIALCGNPSIHEAQARLESARARVADARSRYFPTVRLTHTSTRTFQTPPSRPRLASALQAVQQTPTMLNTDLLQDIPALIRPILQPLLSVGSLESNTNSYSGHSTAITATWTIFDGFIREAQLLASRHLEEAAAHSLADTRRLVIQAVDTAYYQVQLAVEQVRIARADEAFSREQLEETEKLRGAGRASQVDVANFRVRVLAARADLTAATGLWETGRVILAELMGLDEVALADDVVLSPLTEETKEETVLPESESWIEQALRNRPDLRQLEEVLHSEQQRVRVTKGLYSPAIGVSGTWGFDRDSTLHYSNDDQSSLAGLEVRWDLYTGGSRLAQIRAAESARAEAAAALNRTRLAVQAQVRQAIIALRDAQQQIRLQRETLETARESRRLIQAAYVAGKESLTRLNEAQRDFIQADVNLAFARIRLRQAWSDLHVAAGTYPTTLNNEPEVGP